MLFILKKLTSKIIEPLTSRPKAFSPQIAHCIFSLGCGGAERQLLTTTRILAHQKFKQYVLCSSLVTHAECHFLKDIVASGVPVLTAGTIQEQCTTSQEALHKLRFFPRTFREGVTRYISTLSGIAPHIVHIWSGNIHALTAAVLLGIPRILIAWQSISPLARLTLSGKSSHPTELARLIFHRLIYNATLSTQSVICANNSKAGARSFEEWLGLSDGIVTTLYNGMDTSVWVAPSFERVDALRSKFSLMPRTRTIIGAMRFEPMKRPLLWIKTAHTVLKSRKDTTAILFGDGPLRLQLEAYIKAHGLENRIFLPGIEKDMPTAMRLGDVFLLTSLYEGIPNVLLEAQISGVPVVTTNAGGAREAIVNGSTGWVCQDSNIATLAERIQFCLDNTQWREQARRLAPGFIQERFGIDGMINTTLRLYGFAKTTSHTA